MHRHRRVAHPLLSEEGTKKGWHRLVCVAAGAFMLAQAALAPVAAFAATIQTDLLVYQNGDTVTVTGNGFGASEAVGVVTTNPLGAVVDHGSPTTDQTGSFTYQFVLAATTAGLYDVVATGTASGLTASTQFDPPPGAPANLQFRDDRGNGHGVTITWGSVAKSSTDCYFIYRSSAPLGGLTGHSATGSCATPHDNANGIRAVAEVDNPQQPPATIVYADAAAPAGALYYYVTAEKTGNNQGESAASNQVTTQSLNPGASASLNFGNVVVGTPSVLHAAFTNNGLGTISVATFAMSGANITDFAGSKQSPTVGSPVAVGASITFDMTFTPGALGARSANIEVNVHDSGQPSGLFNTYVMPLSGNGVASSGLVANSATGTYGGTASLTATLTSGGSGVAGKTISFTLNGVTAGIATTNSSGVATLAGASLAGINAAAYPTGVGASFSGDSSFGASSGTGSLTVGKATLTVTADDKSRAYGAANPGFTASFGGFQNGQTLANSGVTGSPSLTTTATAASPPGSYTITAGLGTLASNNYSFAFVNGTLAVIQATLTVTADSHSKTYGAANPPLTYTISGFANGDTPAVVSGSASCGTTADASSPVGGYPITCTQGTLSAPDYAFNFAPGTLTVGKALLTVTADPQSRTYGAANPALTYAMAGFVDGDTIAVVSGSASCSTTATASSPVGGYPITCTQGTLTATNYGFSFAPGTLTVNQAVLTVTADSQSKTYGSANPELTYNITGFANGETDSVVSGSASCTTVATGSSGVGDYPITCTRGTLDASNYSFSFAPGTLTVGKAAVTVTADAQSKDYGDADPTLTYQVTSGSLVGSDHFAGALTRDPGEGVGAYAIRQGTLALSSNYTLNFVGANLTIGARAITITADAKSKTYGDADPTLTYQVTSGSLVFGDAFAGALTRDPGEGVGAYAIRQGTVALSSNYTLHFVGAQLTIDARAITVTADAKNKIYGDADPVLTYQVTSGTLVGSDSFSGSLTRVAGEDVGQYDITQGSLALDSNYTLGFVGAKLTIDARAITVSADAKTKVYGESDPALTYHVTSGTLVGSDSFTGALARDTGEDVGAYAIGQGTLALSSNYTLTFGGAELSISQRPVTVSADARTKVYGYADPSLTYQVTSGSLVFSDTFSGALARDAGESAGQYEITQGTLTLGANYALTFDAAELTITPRPITVTADAQARVYGDADPALTYQVTSGSLAFSDSFSGGLARDAGENVGEFAITRGTLALSSNYELSFVGAKLTITARPVTITADAETKVYGDSDPTLTYQVTSGTLVFGDAFAGALTRAAGENAGSYAIGEGTVALSSNYNLSFVAADLTITARPITVSADAKTKVYGESDPGLTYHVTSGTLVGSDSFTGALARDTGEDVGAYAIGQGTLALSSNYTLTFGGAELSISQRPVTVSADARTKVYGYADPSLTYQVTSGSLVFSDTFSGALARDAGESAGQYEITQGTLTLGANYALTFDAAELTITPRPITVTADAQARVYGDADPALTYQVTSGSLAHGDAFTGVLTRAPGESVGTYAIQQGTLDAGANYTLTFSGAQLAITARPVTATADAQGKVYGDADPALTYQVTTGSLAFNDAFSGLLARDPGETVGVYNITQGTLALSSNYTLTFVGSKLTVTRRPLTVTADNKTMILNGAVPALTGMITGALSSDGITASYATADGHAVGSFPIVASLNDPNRKLGNYDVTKVNGTLIVLYVSTGTCDGDAGHAILRPINGDGSSVFKQGSTVPAKFRVCDANGNSIGPNPDGSSIVTIFTLTNITNGAGQTNEDIISTTPDTEFRWDPTDRQWIFNISSKNLTAGNTYQYTILLNDGTTIVFTFGLR